MSGGDPGLQSATPANAAFSGPSNEKQAGDSGVWFAYDIQAWA